MKFRLTAFAATIACVAFATTAVSRGDGESQGSIQRVVDGVIQPLMAKDAIPGMAVGITVAGKVYIFDYGMAETKSHRPVTRDTLFEIGSISKTFTATLASWAQVDDRLSFSDKTAKYLPALQGTAFGNVSLLNLGTHTPGGMPLQVPDDVTNDDELTQYLRQWRPAHAPGTYRTYSNPSIGMLGAITAKAMGQDFRTLMEQRLFPALDLRNTFLDIPAAKMADYAEGYTTDGTPIRMTPGVLWQEAYGVKSTASDMVRFLQANMGELTLNDALQRAVTQTHTGYFQAGPMTQDLIWEQYPYPVMLKALLEGNSTAMLLDATPVTKLDPPQEPLQSAWIDKTGSTNGFGAYVAFIPRKQLGIVMLANKNFRINDRVTAAYKIVTALSP